ncbi:hypothetical protein PENTCL1PPCAC_29709, partial [Pristionchus entomophagus]
VDAVKRLLADIEASNERLAKYEELWVAFRCNLACFDQNQRAWYESQSTLRQMFQLSLEHLRKMLARCSDDNTSEGDLQSAIQSANSCQAVFAKLDLNKYDYYWSLTFFQ